MSEKACPSCGGENGDHDDDCDFADSQRFDTSNYQIELKKTVVDPLKFLRWFKVG